jgi:hypothetical protein
MIGLTYVRINNSPSNGTHNIFDIVATLIIVSTVSSLVGITVATLKYFLAACSRTVILFIIIGCD